jgi:AcrR family transcriptional regulator
MKERTPDLRARILEASVQLIEEQGLAGLSMREVARRAGVSHQAPYHHFPDRAAILAAVAEEGYRGLSERLEAAAAAPGALLDRFTALGRAYVEQSVEHPAHFRVMSRPELADVEGSPGAQAEADRAFGVLRAMVGELVAAGLVHPAHAEGTAVMAWSLVHGLATLLLDGPLSSRAEDPKAAGEAALAAMRGLLEARAGEGLPGGPSPRAAK